MGVPGAKARSSNFELLRIISMLMIVALHYSVYSFVDQGQALSDRGLAVLKLMEYGGRIGVDMFVLISGYFLVAAKPRVKKVLKLWLQVSIVSAVITLAFFLTGTETDARGFIEGFFPLPYSVYWFPTTYFVLYLFSGYINALIKALSRESLLGLIWLLLAICVILPSFFAARMASSNLLLFFMLYLIAAYIRLYSPRLFESKRCLPIGVGLFLLFLLVFFDLSVWGRDVPMLARRGVNFSSPEKATTVLTSVFLFAGFKNLELKSSRFINVLGASTFGVYLIHDNPHMWDFWWKDTLRGPAHVDKPYMLLYAVAAVLLTYTVCTLLDMFYRYCVEKPMWKALDKHWDSWAEKLAGLWKRLRVGAGKNI